MRFNQLDSHKVMHNTSKYFEEILKTTDCIDVWIGSREHANLDSLPIRYGVKFDHNTVLRLENVHAGQTDGKYPDRYHVEAEFEIEGRGRLPGHFVLRKPHSGRHPAVVTVWRKDVKTEFGLSEAMQSLRKDGWTTSADWLALHPLYESGKLKTHGDLLAQLLSRKVGSDSIPKDILEQERKNTDKKAAELLASYEEMERRAKREEQRAKHNTSVALEAIDHLEKFSHANIALTKDMAAAEAARKQAEAARIEAEAEKVLEQVQRAAAETARAQAEAARAQAEAEKAETEARMASVEAENRRLRENENRSALKQRQQVVPSDPDTLIEVLEQQMHRGSSCTILVLRNGKRWHMKTATFDPYGTVTQKARSLVGRRVSVTSWDPINEPGKWSRQGYFRNIYEVQ